MTPVGLTGNHDHASKTRCRALRLVLLDTVIVIRKHGCDVTGCRHNKHYVSFVAMGRYRPPQPKGSPYITPDGFLRLQQEEQSLWKKRAEVTKALELARKEKHIGHSLDAAVTIGLPEKLMDALKPYQEQLRAIFIVSSVQTVPAEELTEGFESDEIGGLRVSVAPSEDPKCERCWVHDPSIGESREHPAICARCQEALLEMGQGTA